MFKFKVDENLPIEAVEVLALAGHNVVSVLDEQLGGCSDTVLASVCQQEARALLTLDLGFADIRAYPPADFAGIIVLRLARLHKAAIVAVISRLTSLLESDPLIGKLWVVDEATVRVRD